MWELKTYLPLLTHSLFVQCSEKSYVCSFRKSVVRVYACTHCMQVPTVCMYPLYACTHCMHVPTVGLLAPICGSDTTQDLYIMWNFCSECAVDRNAGVQTSWLIWGSRFFGHTDNTVYNKKFTFNAFWRSRILH